MMRKWFGLIGGFGVAAWLLYAAWPQTRIEVVLPQQRCYLAGQDFTLQWRHSVEHQLWQEHYRLDGRQLWLDATYMQTFGAGTPSGGQPLLAPPGFIGQRSQVRLPELNWVVSRRAENRIHTHHSNWALYLLVPDYTEIHIRPVRQPRGQQWLGAECHEQ